MWGYMYSLRHVLTAAPERTETSNGLVEEPNSLPISFSTTFKLLNTFVHVPFGSFLSCELKALHTSVVRVNPGGTDRPIALIPARLAPLPPSKNFNSLLLLVLCPLPKRKTWQEGNQSKEELRSS